MGIQLAAAEYFGGFSATISNAPLAELGTTTWNALEAEALRSSDLQH